MGMLEEFKKFAMRGNVVDMAVGIVIGAAFGQIVTSLVEKIISPITGYLIGGVDFKDKAVHAARAQAGRRNESADRSAGARSSRRSSIS